ncbi:TetR/AcrR family transcriptional regulator [Streptomonospora sp. S1-112]|uniref:TetR/AcrR family transcriptional regulator n=1 Tax=Streptomonospora mangrovi TaxID=2883123 RepID=A0A9X3NTK0_9ACTN|nr:TetR/AcrR family transcriptional regulator [Streptomonospora mangrovi]MDA0567946.1 TetR/AcrR family transcriptional regulator [Streptomonospora mangrovi]
MAGRRLSSADRRAQLVGIARDVIASEGTDALTLAYLASRAGISKPVVYDHFSSRSALLLSLYEDFDRRHLADLRAALERTPPELRQRVDAIAAAHVACVVSQGAELSGVMAALVGTPALEEAKREGERRYVDVCRQAIRCADGDADLGEEGAIAFVGAADALGHAAARGEADPERARATIATVLLSVVTRSA